MGESKSTVDSIRQPQLLRMPFVVPPMHEQEKITQWLDERTIIYDKGVQALERSITLLQEFKSALISHVVTGKIKV